MIVMISDIWTYPIDLPDFISPLRKCPQNIFLDMNDPLQDTFAHPSPPDHWDER